MAARRGPAVVAAVLIQSWCASTALAQTPQGATVPDAAPLPDSTRMVDVTIIAGGDDADPLLGSIRELLGRLGLGVDPHVVTAPPLQPPQPTAGLSVWVDLASRYEAVTIVRSGRSEVRRTIPRDSSPAIVREEIGEAVRSGVESQLQADAARNAPPRAPSAPAAPAPPPVAGPEKLPPPPTSSRWFALDLTVFGGGGPVASNAGAVARVGGGVVIGSRRRLRPSLTVTAAYFVPFDAENSNVPNVQAHTTFVSLRAVPAIEVLHTSWLGLNVGAGGGVDIISVDSPQPSDPTIRAQSSIPDRVDPILTGLATAYVALAPSVAFTIVLGTDVDFVARRYVVSPAETDILHPWLPRPFALAGFTFTAVGSELFAGRTP